MRTYNGPGRVGDAARVGGDWSRTETRPDTTPHPRPPIARDAATAAGWGDRPPAGHRRRTIALLAWRPLTKGALRGFVSVELPIGLRLIDCPVYVGKNGPFATLPSKPQIDKESRKKTNPNGWPAYAPVLEWRSRAARPVQRGGDRGDSPTVSRRTRRGRTMTDLVTLFEEEIRRGRAIAAARRFCSRSQLPVMRRSDVVAFLRRRPEQVPEDELIGIADEALQQWMSWEERRVNRALLRKARRQ
jgi:hypothetical protein